MKFTNVGPTERTVLAHSGKGRHVHRHARLQADRDELYEVSEFHRRVAIFVAQRADGIENASHAAHMQAASETAIITNVIKAIVAESRPSVLTSMDCRSLPIANAPARPSGRAIASCRRSCRRGRSP